MNVPFGNLNRDESETISNFGNLRSDFLSSAIKNNILIVIDKKDFILGKFVADFEKAFAEYCGVKHCIGVSNGLSALELSLIGAGVGEGDEVITVANTFNATIGAILKTGAKAVLVDADYDNFNLDISQIESKITDKTQAIMPVHLYGQAVDMDKLMAIADKYNIPIIEDACQAHGSKFNGQRAGSFGLAGCFSFYPGKNLGCYGDGGAIVTNDDNLASFLRKTRNYGQEKKYLHNTRADNSRLDTIQAAVLLPKLMVLDEWNEMRRINADLYRRELMDVKEIELPSQRKEGEHVYHLFVIKAEKRDELERHMKEKGVEVGLHYPVPIHLQPCFSSLGYKQGDFPVSERLSKSILTLPMFPTLREEEVKYVADCIKNFYSKK
jgi:dTDP-4-amino-4,6-dideoxygalactose transaminase